MKNGEPKTPPQHADATNEARLAFRRASARIDPGRGAFVRSEARYQVIAKPAQPPAPEVA